jgi:hypothetical protein
MVVGEVSSNSNFLPKPGGEDRRAANACELVADLGPYPDVSCLGCLFLPFSTFFKACCASPISSSTVTSESVVDCPRECPLRGLMECLRDWPIQGSCCEATRDLLPLPRDELVHGECRPECEEATVDEYDELLECGLEVEWARTRPGLCGVDSGKLKEGFWLSANG